MGNTDRSIDLVLLYILGFRCIALRCILAFFSLIFFSLLFLGVSGSCLISIASMFSVWVGIHCPFYC